MIDEAVYIKSAINDARRLLWREGDGVLEMFALVDGAWVLRHRLTKDWLATHGNDAGFSGWYLSLYAFPWNDIQDCQMVRLKARGQTLTFKMDDVERHVDGNRLRFSMRMIGDQLDAV